VLAVGGLDPSGGAGVVVDVAAVRAAGAHGAAVIAVSTVQSGLGFVRSTPAPAGEVIAAAEAVLATHDVRAVKTGALGSAAVVAAVADLLARHGAPPAVVDPVLASTTGGTLLDDAGAGALRERLLPLAALVTPNAIEAAALSGTPIASVDDMHTAAARLLALGASAVLVKGGHLAGPEVVDVFADRAGRRRELRAPRIARGEVRGTGCALASLIAGHLALGRDLTESIARAWSGLHAALRAAYAIGDGPLVLGLDAAGDGGSEGPALDRAGRPRES
jgi:hydroxymethylpyrimidine/phosphomethylpyrimidine kinase